MASKCYALVKLWESLQVELHDRYSGERVINLEKYTREKSWLRAIAVLVATPLPCLIVTLSIDLLPLSDPSLGIKANGSFIVREYYAYLGMTFLALSQFRAGVRCLPYPMTRIFRDTILISCLTIGIFYGFVHLIGFPLPFTTLTIVPSWASLTVVFMVFQWAKKARETPGAGRMLFGMFKLWLCDFALVFTYPPYFHIFTTLGSKEQMVFTVLLPVIKLLMRNLFSRAVNHLGDEIPELVVFNADVFGSLFVSYCMQSAPSVWTTVEVMVADIVMMGLALRDIELEWVWENWRVKLKMKTQKPTTTAQ
ncbi:hypothetical protein PHYSODRAFT_249988 [Phytophthora sojae]|uniref:Uncharacterized protein n=1 Tax=Phytophthora sojae (strain P6497) TaxID=1094619 RepID=G5ACA4_PHYSP|nr:hypothetical protein PHYSODRAFT_249988 [Phytophthora sojae]EGZ06978.1 hypothetical protein PHYSODRAFT_249988 [Phytophthora sojae]|eukprot:XP_009537742.1 hypothetical protein PHYSODRAFT_249988 [Phytophthora sojae]